MNAAPKPESATPMLGDKALVYRLLRLVNLLSKPFQERFGTRYDLSLNEWRIMMGLAARPGATVTEISDWSGMHVMNVSRGVTRLVRQGRVLREVDPADRRRALLRLSGRGRTLFGIIAPSAQAREDMVRKVLSESEAGAFREMIDRLIDELRQESTDAGVGGRRAASTSPPRRSRR
ncbi:MAG: MarR family winged helix-turn-helix transcriptional regulator [Burkholderiaceae bacterium]|nr:MarR family winged helix-turn-helix transcriptional regulator [Burkholderiaceae bacterium]